jgi:hypothetical protein
MKKLLMVLSIIGFIFAEGKISGVTYFDFSATDTKSAFYFKRQYFGYGGEVSDKVSFKILFDVDRTNLGTTQDKKGDEISEDTRLVTFLKKAQVNYKSSIGNFNFGLIGMNTYGVQESNWGYRFIEKSAIDKNKFSSTADIGVGFSRSLIDNLNLSLLLVNGEGYKKPQGDEYYKIAFNATYGEGNLNKNDGYNAGLVYTTESTDTDPTTMASVFGGFSGMSLRLGAEYDMLTKAGGYEANIISVSANYGVSENLDAFVRIDMHDPDTKYTYDKETYAEDDDKNKLSSNYIIAGIVLACDGGISVAPNLRMVNYENTDDKFETEYKVNFQFKF